MTQFNIFDVAHLKTHLEGAITRNCQVEKHPNDVITLRFQDVSGIGLSLGPQAMLILSERLGKLARLDAPSDPDVLARRMHKVAIVASCAELTVVGPPAKSVQLDLLKRKILTDFALGCALSLAHARGYSFSPEILRWDVIYSVLMVKDDDSLLRLFRESLIEAQGGALDYTVPKQRASDRVLSRVSYWNLISVAEVEAWDYPVIVRLIEEYLTPAPHPHLVHYTYTVSGEEWRLLHKIIFGLCGWMPCRLSPKLFQRL